MNLGGSLTRQVKIFSCGFFKDKLNNPPHPHPIDIPFAYMGPGSAFKHDLSFVESGYYNEELNNHAVIIEMLIFPNVCDVPKQNK